MSEKKREDNNTTAEDSGSRGRRPYSGSAVPGNPSCDEDEQPSLDMGAQVGTPITVGGGDLPPDSPITVGGDG